MNIQAEVSLYPLRSRELAGPIDMFCQALARSGLEVQQGPMSTRISGDLEGVFGGLRQAFSVWGLRGTCPCHSHEGASEWDGDGAGAGAGAPASLAAEAAAVVGGGPEEREGGLAAPRAQRRRARRLFLLERSPPVRKTPRWADRRKSRPSGLRPVPLKNSYRRCGRASASSSTRPGEPPWWRSRTRNSAWDAGPAKRAAPSERSRLARWPGWTAPGARAAAGAWPNARTAHWRSWRSEQFVRWRSRMEG